MGAFADLNDLTNKLTGGGSSNPQFIWFHKEGRVGTGSAFLPQINKWTSCWQYAGQPGTSGSIPTTATICDTTTSGSLNNSLPATASNQNWLLSVGMASSIGTTPGTFFLYDRLAHISGLDSTITSFDQSVSMSINRYTGSNSVGNSIFLEYQQALGAAATWVLVNYKNQSGVIQQSLSQSLSGAGTNTSPDQQRWLQIPLAPGDTGVTAILSVRVVVTSTGTTGSFGVVIGHPLAYIPFGKDIGYVRDLVTQLTSPMQIMSGACLAFSFVPGATAVNAMQYMGNLTILET